MALSHHVCDVWLFSSLPGKTRALWLRFEISFHWSQNKSVTKKNPLRVSLLREEMITYLLSSAQDWEALKASALLFFLCLLR